MNPENSEIQSLIDNIYLIINLIKRMQHKDYKIKSLNQHSHLLISRKQLK